MNRAQQFAGDERAGRDSVSGVPDDATHVHIRFLAWCAGVLAACVALVLASTIVVDPYHLFRVVELDGINRVKPQPTQYR